MTAGHRRLALHGLIPVMQILEGPVSYAQAAMREEAWRRAHVRPARELRLSQIGVPIRFVYGAEFARLFVTRLDDITTVTATRRFSVA